MNDYRFPLNGTFELTARCNLSCKMCLIRIDECKMKELGGRERTSQEWIQLAGEVKETGTIGLLITGGEPMLRSDFVTIYESIAQMGFIITLYTNATLVTDDIFRILQKYPPHRIGITTYGASPETYLRVTGKSEAYHKMLEGVERLRQLPSKLSIRTTIINDNRTDLKKITDWALNLGENVEFNLSRIVLKSIRGGVGCAEKCRLSPEESAAMLRERTMELLLKPFYQYTIDHSDLARENRIDFEQQKEYQQIKQSLYGCEAGMTSYTITWDGKLIGCQMLEDSWTYPFEHGFQEAWDEFPKSVPSITLPEQCIGCKVNCSSCPATRLAETGSLSGFPKYLCKESKLAYEMEQELAAELDHMIEEGMKEWEDMNRLELNSNS